MNAYSDWEDIDFLLSPSVSLRTALVAHRPLVAEVQGGAFHWRAQVYVVLGLELPLSVEIPMVLAKRWHFFRRADAKRWAEVEQEAAAAALRLGWEPEEYRPTDTWRRP